MQCQWDKCGLTLFFRVHEMGAAHLTGCWQAVISRSFVPVRTHKQSSPSATNKRNVWRLLKGCPDRPHLLLRFYWYMEQQSKRISGNTAAPQQGQPREHVTKAPEQWKTGSEPMTAPQAAFLETLCREAGEPFDPKLTKAQASKKIQELKTGRPGMRPGTNL